MTSNIATYTSKPDSLAVSLKKLWQSRALVWVFAKRDLQVKYSQTVFGFGWSIAKPLIGLGIYVFFFGLVLNWSSNDIPYPIYVLTGLIGWNLFSYIVTSGISSLQESSDLIRKIYFPKTILPLSKTLVGAMEGVISFLLLVPLLVYYNISFSWHILLLPIVLLYTMLCGLFLVFIISSLAIKKRDLLQVVPFFLNMAIWLTPVFFSASIFPTKYQFLMIYNPIANMVELWRWIFFENLVFQSVWLINFVIMLFLTLSTFYFFTQQEQKFSDY